MYDVVRTGMGSNCCGDERPRGGPEYENPEELRRSLRRLPSDGGRSSRTLIRKNSGVNSQEFAKALSGKTNGTKAATAASPKRNPAVEKRASITSLIASPKRKSVVSSRAAEVAPSGGDASPFAIPTGPGSPLNLSDSKLKEKMMQRYQKIEPAAPTPVPKRASGRISADFSADIAAAIEANQIGASRGGDSGVRVGVDAATRTQTSGHKIRDLQVSKEQQARKSILKSAKLDSTSAAVAAAVRQELAPELDRLGTAVARIEGKQAAAEQSRQAEGGVGREVPEPEAEASTMSVLESFESPRSSGASSALDEDSNDGEEFTDNSKLGPASSGLQTVHEETKLEKEATRIEKERTRAELARASIRQQTAELQKESDAVDSEIKAAIKIQDVQQFRYGTRSTPALKDVDGLKKKRNTLLEKRDSAIAQMQEWDREIKKLDQRSTDVAVRRASLFEASHDIEAKPVESMGPPEGGTPIY